MKHLATGVVILLLCLALCFTSLAVLDRWTTHATSQLNRHWSWPTGNTSTRPKRW